ncbi:MAG: amino acid adenylation domain-containing protein [Gammaproteobacteria bacterium]
MTVAELLAATRAAGIELRVERGRLLYDAPAGALTPELREALGKRKPELLAHLQNESSAPLGFAQQSLWFLHELYPQDTSASEQFAIRIDGPLDAGVLAQAWQALLVRHSILRTVFEERDGQVWQVAMPPLLHDTRLPQVDATQAGLLETAAAALREPFELHRGPLLKPQLCRITDEQHVLLVTAHHIIADGLSVPVIRTELAVLYQALLSDQPSPLAPLQLEYDDVARAQSGSWTQTDGQREAGVLQRWREILASPPPAALHALPRPPPASKISRRSTFRLDAPLADGLRRLSRDSGATPYVLLLAAFRLLLARLTGQHDLVIGTPMTLRDTPELRGVIGCLVNPVALRTPLDPGQSFRSHLLRERAMVLEVLQYRDVPFSRVVAAVSPERKLDEHPLFQILFSWEADVQPESAGLASAAMGPGAVRETAAIAREAHFSLVSLPAERASYFSLECLLRDAGEGQPIGGYFAWSTAALEEPVAAQLPQIYTVLLAAIVAQPDAPMTGLSLLSESARRQILNDWNDTAAPYPQQTALHDAFLAQAGRVPDAPALHTTAGSWSYARLEKRSAELAAELTVCGLQTGMPVGLCMPRSPEAVIAMLGILRAGGVILPLDPAWPTARRDFVMADAGAQIVLTDLHPVRLDATLKPADVLPDSAAVLLYTSGSTGMPKGAVTTHASAVNRCHWMWQRYGFGARDVFALRTSFGFIDSLWEIFGALSHGIPLVIVPDDIATDALRLPEFLRAREVTHLVLVPSLLRALLDAMPDGGLPALRSCISSGEPLDPALARRFRSAFPGTRLLNTYGTSEIWDATCHEVTEESVSLVRIPIGRPVANASVYVLDANAGLLPPGIPGELVVGGIGVGPGYWRRPELTQEKFITARLRLDGEPQRLYRSGDRARWLADGTLECLGRLDAQFKLRGLRIEPGEIESALIMHPAVAAAIVTICGEGEAARLVAGVVRALQAAGRPDAELWAELRSHLRTVLPAHMVPTGWHSLEEIPLTPSGKLDRRAFAASYAHESSVAIPVATQPRTDIERELVVLWAEVLGRQQIGVDENFFDAGGHSLLATRIVSRIRARYAQDFTLREMFAAPTIAALAAVLDGRQQSKAEVILAPVARDTALQLSFGQERLWFLDQLDPGSPAYNIAWTVRLSGPLNRAALRAALEFLIARHEPLRSRFPAVAGRPQQCIDAPGSPCLVELDIVVDPELQAELTRRAREPFVLATGPLLRAVLVRRTADEHLLMLAMQHIITDATSNHVLFEELVMAYAAFAAGREPALPPLQIQYADYAFWQRQQHADAGHDADIAWWRAQLAGIPTALELPTDYPRPAEQQFHGAWIRRALSPDLVTALRALAREQQCTLYMVLLAAFDVLLCRYSGSTDIVVGTPVEGRTEKSLERLVGLFINTLVMRTNLDGDPTFTELLERVRTVTLEAQAHQDLPFEKLVEALRPARSLSRAPLFQLMFNLIRMPEEHQQAAGLEFCLDRLLDQGVSSFDLTLTAGEQGEHIGLIFEYATDLYTAQTIEQFADSYLCLLDAIVTSPEQLISRLPLLDKAGRQRLLEDFNPPVCTAQFAPVHQAVAANAVRWPDALAISLAETSLSYAELEARANRLAHFLLAQDLSAGARIGICLPRELSYLVAVLAVLKAGAAYVPLDPDYPPARLAAMAHNAELALLLVDANTRSCFADGDTRLLLLDVRQAEIDGCIASPPVISVSADDLAYLLYTSGSTGEPKAVMVTHGNLASALSAWLEVYALQPGESHLQMASAAFDVYTGDWVRALGSGGRLVLCPRETLLEPQSLLALLIRERIAVAEFVPAVIRLLLAHVIAQAAELPPLRLLIVGSDLWFAAEATALRARCAPGTRVFNSYGVAEATIDSACFEVGENLPAAGQVPIGRPLANTRLYVLDARGEPVPAGAPGELCIGGAGVARGYFGQPELSARKFRADAFAKLSGGRLYRSGDRARWRHDGSLELLGRTDFQFKLRGFRIEPGEVEARLMEHPAIRQAVVGRRETAAGDARLVAWVVLGDPALPVADLRLELQTRLPDYLVPNLFVILPALPLSPNGKIDRSALPEPQRDAASVGPMSVGARTPVEEVVCALFAEVLGCSVVGVHDDFFAGGGHSLLATRLVARIRDALQVELPLRAIFTTPTPAGIAAALADVQADRQGGGRLRGPDISRYARHSGAQPTDLLAPLSAMQQRLWFLDRLQPDSRAYHLPWAVRLRGRLDRTALQAAVDALVARHAVLRTRFIEADGMAVQQVLPRADLPEGRVCVECVALNGRDPQQAAADYLQGLHFDLASDRLWRLRVLEIAPDDQLLVLVMHHIIADGWSLSVLNRELATAYQAALNGTAPEWSCLPLQYADYARWQADWLASGELSRQLDFWRQELRDAPALLALPVHQPRESGGVPNGAWHHCILPSHSAAALHQLARAQGCTLFMVLLAAFDVLLGRHAGSEDVLVGTPLAGRPHTELEGLIGFFLNTLVLRADLRGDPAFSELLLRVRRVTLDAYAHADVPFEKLVEALAPQRSLSHSPIVQVLFTLHNQPRTSLALPGLESEPVLVTGEAAKFDLSVHVAEEAGGLDIAFAWRSKLFSRLWVESLAADFIALLEAVIAAPETRISRLLPAVRTVLHGPDAVARRGTESSADAAAPTMHPELETTPLPSELEAQLAEIWQSLLPVASIAPNDDFFAIGGHSLLATRMIARIADRLGVELPLISVFEAPTIRGLALRVAAARQRKSVVPDAIPRLERRAEA